MTLQKIRFNKTTLTSLVKESIGVTVRDTEILGLKFKVGRRRSVFQFEKRISQKSGKKSSPITFTIGAFPAISVEAARQEARRIASLCEQGIDPRQERTSEEVFISLEEAINVFFQVKAELGKRTLRNYNEVLQLSLPTHWLKKDIRAITPKMIEQLFHSIRNQGIRRRPWDFLMIYGNIWNSCHPVFKDGNGEYLLRESPIPEVRLLLKSVKRDTPQRTVVPAYLLGKYVVTLEQILDGTISFSGRPHPPVNTRQYCELFLLCLFTGFRTIEALNLKWEYVDLENGVIHLPGTSDGRCGDFEGTKNHEDHFVPLSSYSQMLLEGISRSRCSESPYVFPRASDPMKHMVKEARFNKKISQLLGTTISAYTNRRTFASVADAAGLGFLTVKRMLNHKFQGGVTGGYIHQGFNPEKDREHFQKVCDYICDCRAEYLGKIGKLDQQQIREKALFQLKRYARTLGIDLKDALSALCAEETEAA